jgi:ABC-type sulfate transport system substrate-binding protein
MSSRAAAERIRKAIALVNSVADEAGDEEIAEAIRDCLEVVGLDEPPTVRRYLGEALDAVSDGMPADFVAMTLYAALGALQETGPSR